MDFNEICKQIKDLKIQGAENVARYGIRALMLKDDKNSVRKLLSLRPTEPLLMNAIKFSIRNPARLGREALKHFDCAESKIADLGAKLIKNNIVVFTHCHSSTVVNALKKAKKTKSFKVFNTETRPLYQGRITAIELNKAGIDVTHFIDSEAEYAISDSDIMVIGADSITNKSIINKIGSGMFVNIAKKHGLPVYVLADSWKYDSKETKIEERDAKEVWNTAPKGIKIKNYAFEKIDINDVDKIISELGVCKPKEFLKNVKINYPWIQGRGDEGVSK